MFKLVLSTAIVLFAGTVLGASPAQDYCKTLYRIDADHLGTQFMNEQCQVKCNFTGRYRMQNINEGNVCPPGTTDSRNICREGRCVPRSQQFLIRRNIGRLSFGSTKVEMANANEIDTYLLICVMDNSVEAIDIPLDEWQWSYRCHSCASDIFKNTKSPYWIEPCALSEQYPIHVNSRIIFELWQWRNNGRSQFLCGATVKLNDVIQRADRKLTLALANGSISGSLSTEISFN